MPEVYLSGGDTLQSVDNPNWQGQTFMLLEDFVLEFIDLEMRGSMRINQPVIQIFNRDAHHKPWGNCLSRNMWITEQKASFFTTGRVRFKMESLLLGTEQWYVIIVQNYPSLLGNPASWQYDKDDGAYPRGLRISSPDSGATWTIHYNDDFMFAVFGDPPLPKPEPPPPIDNFAVLTAKYLHYTTSITFTFTTSVPCHLFCYYTDKKPLRHRAARIVRGLSVPWGAYFCFVAWKKVEQTELGDTFIHTFQMPNWVECQTKWFTFRGEVDNIQSPSVGPIFKHHHPGVTIQGQFEYNATHAFGAYGTSSAGQRLTIHNRLVTSFGFWVRRTEWALDEVYYEIRRVEPRERLFYQRVDNALFSPTEIKLIEVKVDPPIPINFEIQLLIEHRRRYPGPRLVIGYWNEDILPAQNFVAMSAGSLIDYPDRECAYAVTKGEQ